MWNPADWYWIVGGNEEQVYSSARRISVPTSDTAYLAWLAALKPPITGPTKIASQAELDEVLERRALSSRAIGIKSDARRIDLTTRLKTATPAQISTWIDNNVTNLAQVREVLKAILLTIALDTRE